MISKRLLWMLGGLIVSAVAVLAATATVMSVQVRKADVRDTPSFLGNTVLSLAYGDKVTVDQQNGPWMHVTVSGQSGWLHTSALTSKTIVMKAGDAAQTSASSGEMALAGKGFNSDVEAQFKADHRTIDFGPVDRMEKINIPAATLLHFAKEGDLVPKGGAR